jgi:RNA polymerase sigma factor (sigma-70 family)
MSEPEDFEQLVLRYQRAVCAVAYAVLRERARSEEVAQEAFLIAWQKLPAMTPPPKLPAWICGIARNLAANAARRRKETVMETEPIVTATPLDAVLDAETERLARAALASLPERDREVLVLYYRGDESLAQVATDLGISEVAARQRLHRGRERLKAAFGSVEKTLRATRPGPAFAGACVAALATRGGAAHAAGTRAGGAATKTAGIAIGAVAIVAIGAWSITRGGGSETSAPASGATPSATSGTVSDELATRKLDRDARAAARSRIAEAQAQAHGQGDAAASRASGASSVAAPTGLLKVYDFSGSVLGEPSAPLPPSPPGPPSDKTVIRRAIRAIEPLLLECVSGVRAGGTLAVKLHVVGDGVGAIVDTVDLDGDAALAGNRELAECVRETWLSLELPAMTGADAWEVHYPLVVRGR